MQSEEFDNKVRKAADHHYPAYDEKAWDKMEQLLDKHLPQEKDDQRRIIFFLLLFLLLGGGIWYFASLQNNKNKPASVTNRPEKNTHNSLIPVENNDRIKDSKEKPVPDSKNKIAPTENKISDNTQNPGLPVLKESTEKNAAVFNKKKPEENKLSFSKANGITKKERTSRDIYKTNAFKTQQEEIEKNQLQTLANSNTKNRSEPFSVNKAGKNNTDDNTVNKDIPVSDKSDTATKAINIEGIKNNQDIADKPVASKAAKAKKKKNGSFFFSLSAGPDVSFAGSGKAGKAKLLSGAGLGYTFNNRVTIRTGFYTARKIYSASAKEYHPPAEFYTYHPYLISVNADCKVFEIPVSFSYNFGNSSKRNWFVSGGLSSYLMKRELYDYYYKYTPTGPTLNSKWKTENKNKHYFSVLTLSGGYQHKINNSISLAAEPFIKLPLSGVGYGKVKLNSGGMLFSISIKPFKSTLKKQRQ